MTRLATSTDDAPPVRLPVCTCAICNEPILMDYSEPSDPADMPRWNQEFEAAAEAHVLSHPEPVRERFFVRRFLEDFNPNERAEAVKRIYTELRQLWGDLDCRGEYGIEEVLGSVDVYRLWLDANRCGYARCKHTPLAHSEGSNILVFMRSMAKRLQDEEFANADS